MSGELRARRRHIRSRINDYRPLCVGYGWGMSLAELKAELATVDAEIQAGYDALGQRWREYCATRRAMEEKAITARELRVLQRNRFRL